VLGAFMATFAIIWPAGILVFFLQRFILKMQDPMKKKVVQYAAATLAIGLVLSSALEIALQINHGLMAYLLSGLTIAIVLLTRWHPLYLIALGALLGACGLI